MEATDRGEAMQRNPVEAILVGKWSVGYASDQDMTLLLLEFSDRAPINLAISRDSAHQIATAILDQLRKSPPTRQDMN